MKYIQEKIPGVAGMIDVAAYVPDDLTQGRRARGAVLVLGGGGYAFVSDRETEPLALQLAARGFNAYTAQYHVAPHRWPVPVQDAAAAMAWIRRRAAEDLTDPNRVAVMGFSAGGHLAGSLGVWWQDASFWQPLHLTPEDVRPNAMVLAYPVISGGEYAHRGSFENLTGSDDLAVHDRYSLEKAVTSAAPRTFLWHTWEDGAVPVQNTLLMAQALKAAGVTAEVHIYPHGGHGLSLCNELTDTCDPQLNVPYCAGWIDLAVHFLQEMGGETR